MSEISGFWTTSGSPAGHQVSSYTQVHASIAFEITARCSGTHGVAPTFGNELAGSVPGANTARIATGGAVADGKWYKNDAPVDVNIPSAVGGGNTRIDRIVLRVSWASFQAVITRIAGTDAASPTAPAITQTPGTTFDIKLYQALVDTAGTVTLTDERDWSLVDRDDSTIEHSAGQLRVKDDGITNAKMADMAAQTAKVRAAGTSGDPSDVAIPTQGVLGRAGGNIEGIEAATQDTVLAKKTGQALSFRTVDTAMITADAVDDTIVGNRVPQFYRRQGGSATNWATQGTSTQTPGAVRMQAGVRRWTGIASFAGDVTVTFPVAFSNVPIVIATHQGDASSDDVVIIVRSTSATQVTLFWRVVNETAGLAQTVVDINWLAIGSE